MTANWGSVPDWVAAAGTLVAFGALRVAIGEQRRNNRERRDSEKHQARMITIGFLPYTYDAIQLTITNHSAQPIIEVKVETVGCSEYPDASGVVQTPAGHSFKEADVIGAGDVEVLLVQFRQSDGTLYEFSESTAPGETGLDLTATIEFTDVGGLRWRRTNLDEPQRILSAGA